MLLHGLHKLDLCSSLRKYFLIMFGKTLWLFLPVTKLYILFSRRVWNENASLCLLDTLTQLRMRFSAFSKFLWESWVLTAWTLSPVKMFWNSSQRSDVLLLAGFWGSLTGNTVVPVSRQGGVPDKNPHVFLHKAVNFTKQRLLDFNSERSRSRSFWIQLPFTF